MRPFLRYLLIVGAAMLIAGCATSPTTRVSDIPRYDSTKPQVFLPGANVEQAKGVAMGSAVTKGWEIAKTSSGQTLVLERRLNAASADALVPGSSLGTTPPRIQVETNFFPRGQGVDVVVGATLVSSGGKEGEQRQDVTESYRPDLERSLASLSSAWSRSGGQVASATPPIRSSRDAIVPVDPDVPLAPLTATVGASTASSPQTATDEPAVATVAGTSAEAAETGASGAPDEDDRAPGTGIATGWLGGSSSSPAPVVDVTSPPPAPPAAQISRGPEAPPPYLPSSLGVTDAAPMTSARPSDNMLALGPSASSGVWSYYAEHYARVRGCTLAGDGAVMVEKTPGYETHRVYCEGGQTFLVRCNAGMCQGVQ